MRKDEYIGRLYDAITSSMRLSTDISSKDPSNRKWRDVLFYFIFLAIGTAHVVVVLV